LNNDIYGKLRSFRWWKL